MLAVYLLVVNWRYRVGWITAGDVTLVAWVTELAVFVPSSASVVSSAGFDATGMPYTG